MVNFTLLKKMEHLKRHTLNQLKESRSNLHSGNDYLSDVAKLNKIFKDSEDLMNIEEGSDEEVGHPARIDRVMDKFGRPDFESHI